LKGTEGTSIMLWKLGVAVPNDWVRIVGSGTSCRPTLRSAPQRLVEHGGALGRIGDRVPPFAVAAEREILHGQVCWPNGSGDQLSLSISCMLAS